jgi:hypothetical protein
MASIFRRKRSGKYTGNWIVRVDGKDTNLGTKDKREASERARLAIAGEWPRDADADSRSAARNLAEDDDPAVEAPRAPAAPTARPVEAAPEPPAESEPESEDLPAAEPASVGDLNAAAVDADAAFGEMADAAGVTPEEMKGAIAELMSDAPQLVAGIHLAVQGILVQIGYYFVKGKRTKTALVPKPIGPEAPERRILALGWKAALAKADLNIETIPWWAPLLLGMAWTATVQVKSADVVDTSKPAEKPAATPTAPKA